MLGNLPSRRLAVEPDEASADLLDSQQLLQCVLRGHGARLADGAQFRLHLAVELRLLRGELAGNVLERDRREVKDIARPHMVRRGRDLLVGLVEVFVADDEPLHSV